ncbi:hypothetical protein [Acinetobacter bereziniae]|uniref:hypothetical protein n=1 Tax=Acinetobacter bereziniae TaxID=106648 RepID=UPI0021D1CE81|nr:hypothetical protein [Acinetobacter bereziniae]
MGDSAEKNFTVKDKRLMIKVTYNKKIIQMKNDVYIFWISVELSESEASNFISEYLREYFIKADIELIGDE